MDRRSVARRTLEAALQEVLPALPGGVVMDVGSKDARYRHLIPAT